MLVYQRVNNFSIETHGLGIPQFKKASWKMGMLLNPVCVPMIRISIVGWMTLGEMPSFDHDSCGFI
jgi:hypothetical protein